MFWTPESSSLLEKCKILFYRKLAKPLDINKRLKTHNKKVAGEKNIPQNNVIEATKSMALKKSPFRINKLFRKSRPPINNTNCKGNSRENTLQSKIIDAIESINPKTFTNTIEYTHNACFKSLIKFL